jgi:acyl dehydratase
MKLDCQPATFKDLPVPADQRFFEDFLPGTVCEYGSIRLDEADIIAFAKQYDTQSIHTDPEAAACGPYRGLIASGWQTAAVMMRLLADHFVSKVANLGSPGMEDLHWLRPVRPGDSLSVRVTILDARRSRSKPFKGIVRSLVEVLNQNGDIVMTLRSLSMVRCRDATPASQND